MSPIEAVDTQEIAVALRIGLRNVDALCAANHSLSSLTAWCLWVCLFDFQTALTFEACVKELVLKGGQV